MKSCSVERLGTELTDGGKRQINYTKFKIFDLDGDGQLDIVPYHTNHEPSYDWNETKDFQYFSFNKVTLKFEYKKDS